MSKVKVAAFSVSLDGYGAGPHQDLKLITALEARGVSTAIHYPCPLHLQPAFSSLGLARGSFPCAERACERALSLPFYPELTDEQIRYAARELAALVG